MKKPLAQKKITKSIVARFLICLCIAFVLWFYVMYTESPEYDRVYHDIRVEVRGYTDSYQYDLIYPETISVTFRGTNVDLSKCESENIVAIVDLGSDLKEGAHVFSVKEYLFSGDTKLKPLSDVRLTIRKEAVEMYSHSFENISVSVSGFENSSLKDMEFSAEAISSLTITGRQEDIEALKREGVRANVSLTADDLNAFVEALNNGDTYEKYMTVNLTLKDGMTYSTSGDATVLTTVVRVNATAQENQETLELETNAVQAGEEATE